jgi:hypothetical protein
MLERIAKARGVALELCAEKKPKLDREVALRSISAGREVLKGTIRVRPSRNV